MTESSLEFQALRNRGLTHLQDLSGELWTDYNLHDPGVTLLEALVYGLTDIGYRLDFPIADLLAGPDGLDLAALGLLRPERALPCRPATADDIRAALLDALPEVDDVWVRPVTGRRSEPTGLIDIYLSPREELAVEPGGALLARARSAFQAIRNTGEDADRVEFARTVRCRLHVALEVDRQRSPERIVADVYERCAGLLHAGPRAVPFDELRRTERPLDEVFEGPLGRSGVYSSRRLARGAPAIRPIDLGTRAPQSFFRAVGEVEGVRVVRHLAVEPIDAPANDGDTRPVVLSLCDAGSGTAGDRIVLTSRGRRLDVDDARVAGHRRRIAVERARAMRLVQDAATVRATPAAGYRDVAAYTLVQHHLPTAYGVDREGLPRSAGRAARERARQLRGFLLLAEQPLADTLAQLADVRRLFAAAGTTRSYASAGELGELLPATERDLCSAAGMAAAVFARDDVVERRGRVLDYLLALYGEQFSQNSLTTFDLYCSPGERSAAVVARREGFLLDIEMMTRDRGGAADLALAEPAEDPPRAHGVGGFARRIARLLDVHAAAPWQWLGLVLAEHDLEPGEPGDGLAGLERETAAIARTFDALVQLTEDGAGESLADLVASVREVGLLPAGALDPRMLVSGIDIARFRLAQLGGGWQLFLELGPDELDEGMRSWAVLGVFAGRDAGIRAANRLRRALVALSRASEGLHVVEHILLRARQPETRDLSTLAASALQLTVVMPGWTPRLARSDFRQLVAETVRLNCPAHVLARCVWFDDIENLLDFEICHAVWRDALAAYLAATELEDDAAAELDARARDVQRLLGLGPDLIS